MLVPEVSLIAHEESDFGVIQRRITDIYSNYSESVFSVYAAHDSYNERGELQREMRGGTGFFISNERHVLTTGSIVANSARVWISIKGVNYLSELIGVETSTNIALLKAYNLPEDINFVIPEVNQSLPEIGSMAVMIACPLGYDPAPSLVLISGTDTWLSQTRFDTTHIRIDKAIISGEPGAPVIDLNGRFQGVLVKSFPDLVSGYLLPAKAVIRVRDDLLFNGKFVPGWIGLEIAVQSNIGEGKKIYLTDIVSDSPAFKAGLKKDDVLVQLGDFKIKSFSDVQNAMFFSRFGQFLDAQVLREGNLENFLIKIEANPDKHPKIPPIEITNPSDTLQQVIEGVDGPEDEPS